MKRIKCQNCDEELEEGEDYKLVRFAGSKQPRPLCDVCWDDYEEELVANRQWYDLIQWEDLEVFTVGGRRQHNWKSNTAKEAAS